MIRQTHEVLDPAESLRVLRRASGAVRVPREAVRVTGPDAVSFLQGQLSQDVAALAVGDTAYSLVLQPQGKVESWVRAVRLDDAEVVLEVEPGRSQALLARLNRFKLRTNAVLEVVPWACVAVRGPAASEVTPRDGDTIVCEARWPLHDGVDLVGPSVTVPEGVAECHPDAYEVLRIESGVPRLGAELDDHTIPAEAGHWLVDVSVSFTKGCYTGQELVARVDSRGGNVPRRLRGVRLDRAVPAGSALLVDGDAVGALTSCAVVPDVDGGDGPGAVGLAYVSRKVDVPTQATVAPVAPGSDALDGDSVAASIEELPLR